MKRLLVLVLALAGCAPALPLHGGGSSPTAKAPHRTPSPKPVLPAWTGNCTQFFTDAQSQAVTGQATTLQPANSFIYAFDAVTTLAGGHDCAYSDANSDSEHVVVSIFPATLPGAAASAPTCAGANAGPVQFQDICTAGTVAHGYWMTMDFSPGTTLTYAQAFAAVNAMIATFTTATATFAPPVAPAAIAGTWVKTETCDTLATHSGAAATIGYPAFGHAVDPVYDGNGPAFTAAQTSVGAIGCQWGSQTGLAPSGKLAGFQVYLVPGAGKLNPPAAIPTNATAVTIPGATSAWDIEYNGNNVVNVFVVAGSNYLEFTPDGNQVLSLAAIAPAISKILSTMNAGG